MSPVDESKNVSSISQDEERVGRDEYVESQELDVSESEKSPTTKQEISPKEYLANEITVTKTVSLPGDSQNQQWVYLTLMQQQIDILRTQMMHLLSKDTKINTVSVSTNTSNFDIRDFGTNTSFKQDFPEKVCYCS